MSIRAISKATGKAIGKAIGRYLTGAAVGIVAAGLLLLPASAVEAQVVNKADALCRKAANKVVAKHLGTVAKVVDKCWKDVLKSKRASTDDCNDVSVADFPKLKAEKSRSKLLDTLGGAKPKCDDAVNAAQLVQYSECPSPGPAGPIAGFSDVGACLADVIERKVEQAKTRETNPDADAIIASPLSKVLFKCVTTVGKAATKLLRTVVKEGGKCQAAQDKLLGSYEYVCSGADPKQKIQRAGLKLNDKVGSACGLLSGPELAMVGACTTNAGALGPCLVNEAVGTAGGVTAVGYEFAGVCPASLTITQRAGTGGGGRLTSTRLASGWTGHGHFGDLAADEVSAFDLVCGSSGCESCFTSPNCSQGNCRCANDLTALCDEPFGPDVNDCGAGAGNDCLVLEQPLPVAGGGVPLCIVSELTSPGTGLIDAGTGAMALPQSRVERYFTGIDVAQPCPTCDLGVCAGGDRDGLACNVDSVHSTFGSLSLDCPPSAGGAIGAGSAINRGLTSATSTLGAALPCGGGACPCAVCFDDETVACSSDGDCPTGICGASGTTGAVPAPHLCSSSFTCVPAPGVPGDGICLTETDLYCDGILDAEGRGYVPCSTTPDCDAIAGGPGLGGSCALLHPRPCFLDPIVATGQETMDGGVLVSTYCQPPTTSVGLNATLGLPGPVRVEIAADYDMLCADGVTPWQLGGSNCP